jgi:amino acid adenylation domain-containing protein/non-ribosomal peptide synthase protein (TIGR01720 family)
MTIAALIDDMARRGVHLWLEDGRLRFRAPKDAGDALDLLRRRKDEIVAHLSAPVYPLTPGQKALWFLHERAPNSAAYTIAFAARVLSPIDRPALDRAVQALVDRHPALATAFPTGDEPLVQTVRAGCTARVDVHDATGLDEAALQAAVKAAYRRPFDITKPPLLRVDLFTRGAEDHVLLLTLPHIAGDAWSLWLLLDDLKSLYPAGGALAPAPAFGDFVRWQAGYLAGPEAAALAAERERALADAPAALDLPLDRSRPPIQTDNGASFPFRLPPEVAAKVKTFAQREDATLFMVLLTVWQVLLARTSGQTDIVAGIPAAGRTRPAFDRCVGYFVNPVVVRTLLDDAPTFRAALGQVKAATAAALAGQDYPFPTLVDRLRPQRDPARSPLFQISFTFQQPPPGPLAEVLAPAEAGAAPVPWGGLALKHFALDQQEGQFELTLEALEIAGTLAGVIKYNTDLFEPATIERMAGHYAVLLEGAVADPERTVDTLPMMGEAERQVVLAAGRGEERPYDLDRCLHHWIAERAALEPDATAVVDGERTLSRGELDRIANRLAHRLRAQGVGPDVPVGVCFERSLEMVVALLAVLKAGGAYVPLDPGLPSDRLAFMLEDARPVVVLTAGRAASRLPGGASAPVLSLDDPAALADESTDDPLVAVSPDHLAYIIYTSGSTGRPKGAANSHRAICNRLLWMQEEYGLAADDVVLQKTPFSFDVSVWEFFWPLMTGAVLTMAPPGAHQDPDVLLDLIARQGVTTLHFVPSMLQAVVDLPAFRACSSVRRILCSGEALPPDLRDRVFAATAAELHNLYGPTEAAVDVSFWACRRDDPDPAVPIGRAIANTTLRVLDRWLEPVPDGVPGELFIGGVAPARGYPGRPGLTAERFIPDPFADRPGARLYRTGDLVRRRADGAFLFLGRCDHQVKIRGNRIELGEVESVLAGCPGLRECVVVARATADGRSARLIAYAVPDRDPGPAVDDLRRHLAVRLPEYMVPSVFVMLPALPLTPSGKVDRGRLPDPGSDGAPRPAVLPPRTPTETALAAIWAKLLGQEQVGVEDGFFALGGDSILAIQAASRAARQGLRFRVADLFRHQTVAALAALVDSAPGAATATDSPVAGPVPLTPIQRWFLEEGDEAGIGHFAQAVLVQLPADVDTAALERGIRAAAAAHDALSLRFARDEAGAWSQRALPDAERVRFSLRDVSALADPERGAAITAHSGAVLAGFDPAEGPLLAAVLYRCGSGEPPRLLLAAHHLVIDGVSWPILLEDIAAATRGGPSALPPPSTSFRRFAGMLAEVRLDPAEIDHWHAEAGCHASGARLVPAGSVSGRPAESRRVFDRSLPGGDAETLLVTALARAVLDHTGGTRLTVALEAHGRAEGLDETLDLSRSLGWFTALYPVTLDLSAEADAEADVAAVRAALSAVPRGGLGWGVLRYRDRDPAVVTATPDVLFTWLGRFDGVAEDGFWQGPAPEALGPLRSPDVSPRVPLEITAHAVGGRLHLDIRHDDGRIGSDAVAAIVDGMERNLHRLGGTVVEDSYPLTALQQGLWFQSRIDPLNSVYFQQLSLDITGFAEAAELAGLWQRLVERHPALRTRFPDRQEVLRRFDVPLTVGDWSDGDAEARLRAFLADDRKRGIDPAEAPPHRLALFRRGPRRWTMVWSFHHLILDGWSLGVLFRELAALSQGATLNPAQRPRDYVGWLARRNAAAAKDFWTERLRDITTATPLGFAVEKGDLDFGAPFGTPLSRDLDAGLTARIETAARKTSVTLATVVQAAWALLLARSCGESRVVFGTTVALRPPGMEDVVGLLVNTVPVRIDVPAGALLGDWLRAVQEQQAQREDFSHADLASIQRCSAVAPGRPLFESLMVFENYPVEALLSQDSGPLSLSNAVLADPTHYPLTVVVAPGPRLSLRVTSTDPRFPDNTVARVLDRLAVLLDAMAVAPQARIADLPWLCPADVAELPPPVVRPDYQGDEVLPALLAKAVTRHGAATALSWGEERWSYDRLWRESGRIAAALVRRGVGPEHRVGLAAERSAALVAAIAGILRAGAAYVPLDPAYPPARLAYMAADAGLSAVLTGAGTVLPDLPAGLPVLALDTLLSEAEPGGVDLPALVPDNAAYVIYTSGSTGRPKGVVVTHRNVARLFQSTRAAFAFGAEDVWTLFHSYAFDFSVWELWGPLLHGGRLVVVPYWTSRDPAAMVELVRRERITVLNQTPSAFRAFLAAEAATAPLDHLRLVIFGGEALDPRSLAVWTARHGTARPALVNMYGITETTVHVTLRRLADGDIAGGVSVIGAPLGDLSLHVLDPSLRPVPVGVAGELFVGGAGLARGYLDRPGLTAQRFLPDPWAAEPGARLYRTGDLARRLPGGDLAYLGRIDQQVKVRGFRIELAEIEAALERHPMVRAAAVTARRDLAGETRLAAYVVADGPPPDTGELRRFVGETLPDYMIPAAFVTLAALPLTRNGKLDRDALPEPETARRKTADTLAPRNDREAALAEEWSTVLGIEGIGVDDNYFSLGGDSIKAIQVVSRLLRRGLKLKIRDLLRTPTIAALAPLLIDATTVKTRRHPGGPAPLAPLQARFLEQHLVDPAHFNYSLLLRADHPLDPVAVAAAGNALLRHHDALRLRFFRRDGVWMQEVTPPVPVVFTSVDLTGSANPTEDLAAHAATEQRGLDPATGRLLRLALYRRDDADRVLLLVHHLAVDGISARILMEDFIQAYSAIRRGGVPELPAVSDDFLAWTTALPSLDLAAEEAWWAPVETAPFGRLPETGTAGGRYRDARAVDVKLDEGVGRALLVDANTAFGTTTEDLLLTALGRALQRCHGAEASLIALEGHGREDLVPGLDLSRTLGWFTSLFPVRIELPADRDPGWHIRATKDMLRRVPSKGAGYGVLRYLRNDTTCPSPQIVFNYLGGFQENPGNGFTVAIEPTGPSVNPDALRPFPLEVMGLVSGGRLVLSLIHDSRLSDATVAALADAFKQELVIVAGEGLRTTSSQVTPSDFTLTDLGPDELDEIIS